MVAPSTGTAAPKVKVVMSSGCTLACGPPGEHSAPQFRMYAVLLSALKTA